MADPRSTQVDYALKLTQTTLRVAKSKVYHVISKRRIVFRFHGGKIVALMTENIMREIWMSNSVATQPVGISQYSAMVFV